MQTPAPPIPPCSQVCTRAVSSCTLSLIGSAVQCAAVDSDKSFFQGLKGMSAQGCLPCQRDTGGGERREEEKEKKKP